MARYPERSPVTAELDGTFEEVRARFDYSMSPQVAAIILACSRDAAGYANDRRHLMDILDLVEEALASWRMAQPEMRETQIYRGGSHVAVLARKPDGTFARVVIIA